MFRWGIIFLVIALIAAALGLVAWRVRLPGLQKSSLSSVLFCSWLACLPGAGAHRKRSFPAAQDAKGVLMT
ncbi:Uncharacterised protein [Raoultella ornithinolytica]|nr:Uncharacterised protein [Raoultella ornithinolytica]